MRTRDASAADSAHDARVAAILAVAAVVTAGVGTRATVLLGDASGSWDRAGKQALDRANFTTRFGIAAYDAGETWLQAARIRTEAENLRQAGTLFSFPNLRRDAVA